MISKIKKPVSILLSLIMIVSLFTIVPFTASAAFGYSDLARGTLIQPGDSFYFDQIDSFKFADYNDPTIIHEVKGSDFSYNWTTLSVTDGYYSFGSTKLLPTSVSPGGLLIADYDSTTKMATFGVQNITHSFDETTGTLTVGGTGVVPRYFAFTGSDVGNVIFTQSNLVKHLIIDATDMIAIKQDAFMAYTGGCVLEDVEINSTSSTPLIIERNAVFYESGNTVTLTVNAVKLATVTNSPVDNYSTPVNLIYNVEQPITFKKNALTEPRDDLTVTFPAGCKIFIPGGPQFTYSWLQEEYDREAEYGYEEYFWRNHSDLVEGTDYVLGDARYEELTPLNASLVVGDSNTALFSAYTITDESVNGTVTASVNGTDVTEAAADADVLLTVAPDNGYQFKSISATYQKNKVEEFSDLVALMGDAVFSAATYADHPDYTCKVNDGKFVVYDGDTSVAELSEANMTNADLGGTYFSAQCGGLNWSLNFRNGSITDIYVYDSDYNYIFSSADGSKSTGTLPPAVLNLTTVTEGSQYSLTMPKMPVTVTAEFEEAPAPETFKVYVKKPTNETYTTIENLTGETTVAQLKEIIADQIDIPATAQRLIFAGKEILDDAKTLAECKIVDESTIHLVIRGYTVTWLNYDNSELGTTTVQYGSTPTYDGETPTKDADENYTYTFAGWKVGETTYALNEALPPVTGDVTYTATFDATAKVDDTVPESEFLTFTAVENNSSVTLNVYSGSNLLYNKNNSGWQSYTAGTQIALSNAGDSVRFRGKDTTFNDSNFVSIGGKVACSGNVMSLRLDDNGMVQGLSEQCFFCMFMGCTGLTAAPELPETMLAEGCYSYMFYGCTSLTTAPALPATNLAEACYYGMFYDCENLTTAPKLPATTLANECYNSMFEDCERLTTAPELPATTLAQYCYYHMFAGCSSIKLSETKTAEYSIPYSVPSGGNGTTASAALTGMFANTGGTFKGTPVINKTYYVPAPASTGETITIDLNPDNATVIWYDATDSDGYWSMEAAYNDSCYLVLKGNSNQPAGTYEWADMGSGCGIRDYDASQEIYFVDGSCTVTVDEDVVTVSGTFTGRDRNTYVVTVTYEAPYYTITDESVNGAVTAEVNGADVTKAKAGKTVLLNVAPADGYQLKSITASAQKTIPENFSDLVALMGDAVFDGDENYDCGGYTCKVENGKFVVYNGANLLAELSESNMTGFNVDGDYVEVNSEDALWAFYVKNGEITGLDVSDTNDDYIFCADFGSKSTGTLQPVQVDLTTVAEGSQYSFTMPAKNVTVKAEFEEAPAPAKLIAGHSLTLDGDIGVNFYLDPSVAGMTVADVTESNLSYTFAWADGVNAKVNVAGQSGSAFKRVNKDGKDYIMVTCKVCAAEMSCGVKASFTLGGKPEGETYSVRDYCDTILKTSNDALLIDLATKMLQYGAKAQTVFSINTSDPADSIVPPTTDPVPADVTDEMIDKAIAEETENGGATADDMNTVASGLGAKWYATTLIYLSENTLRHYFIKDTDTFNPSDYTASKSDYYYYVQVTDIPAAKLDKLQTFTAGNKTFKYSALDCVKGVLHSSASDYSKNLAKALYWYNKAANAYFRL